jgi:hypothetical protein
MPQSVGFGVDATQLSEASGAGATPVKGVETPAQTLDLAPITNLASNLFEMFKEGKKQKAEADNTAFLRDFSEQLDRINQGSIQGTLSREKAAVERGLLISRTTKNRPDLAKELTGVLNVDKQGIGGVIEDEATAARKRRNDDLDDIRKQGIPLYGASKEVEDSMIDSLNTGRRIERQIKEMRETEEFNAKRAGWDREAAAATRKEQSSQLLVEYAGKHATSFNSFMFDLVERVNRGEISTESANRDAQQYKATIDLTLSSISSRDPELASPFKSAFDNTFKVYQDALKPGADIDALKRERDRLRLSAEVGMYNKSPKFLQASVVSSLFGNNPEVFLSVTPILSDALMSFGLKERGLGKVDGEPAPAIIGSTKLEKQAYQTIGKGITASLDGNAPKEKRKEMQTEVFGQMRGVLGQYVENYQLNKLTPESRRNMTEFLLNKDTVRFLKENPLPVDVARGLSSAAEENFKQFENTFRKEASDVLMGADIRTTVQKMTGRGMSGNAATPRRSPNVDAIDAVNISWRGDRIIFEPREMPVDRFDQNRLVTRLNEISNVLSNGVKVGAHVEGSTEYGQYFEKVKHRLFPSKFEAPPQSNDKTALKFDEEKSLPVSLSPAEQARSNAFEASDGNLKELEAAIARETNPDNIRTLLQERDKLMRMRNAR